VTQTLTKIGKPDGWQLITILYYLFADTTVL